MSDLPQKSTTGATAVKIAADIEAKIREGTLTPGELLPPVRDLALEWNVNPATAASAYRMLQARALVTSQGRRGTRVTHRPLAAARRPHVVPRGTVNLADGNPDPALLPDFGPILRRLKYQAHLYGQQTVHQGLIQLMRREMQQDGVIARATSTASSAKICIVNGTMDGLDRLLAEHLRPGDRVAVEDPGFMGHHDLIASRGLALAPIRIDEFGMLPDALAQACAPPRGVKAVLITPRAQSPTGAALSEERARELRAVLRKRPDILVIEDDHASFLCEGLYHRVHDPEPRRAAGARAPLAPARWAHLRSFSKSFNPDLRLSVMTGDDHTMTRLLDRLIVVERWVSTLLQSLAYEAAASAPIRAQVRKAGRIYDQRREALIAALQKYDFQPIGSSGYNIWLKVDEETPTVQALAAAGWAVAAGERFRLSSPPGVRITASSLAPAQAQRFAADLAAAINPPRSTLHV